MLTKLATFLYANGRRVLFVAVLAAAIAGAFGVGVAKHLSPYGANDPATQSVQATNRFEAATDRQIDPGVVALVSSGDVRSRGRSGASSRSPAELRAEPDVASVVSYYDTHDPAMVSRDRRSTYVLAYFKPRSDKQLEERREADRGPVRRAARRAARRRGDRQRPGQHAGRPRPRARRAARVPVHLPALAAVLPLAGGGAAAAAARRPGDRRHVLRAADRRRASPTCRCSRSTSSPASGSGWRSTTACSWSPATARRRPARASACGALRRTLETSGRTILFSSLTVAAAIASLTIFPQRFLYSMGIAGALVALIAAALALIVLPALLAVLGPRVNALAPERLQRARRARRAAGRARLLVPAVALRDAAPGRDRRGQRRRC